MARSTRRRMASARLLAGAAQHQSWRATPAENEHRQVTLFPPGDKVGPAKGQQPDALKHWAVWPSWPCRSRVDNHCVRGRGG